MLGTFGFVMFLIGHAARTPKQSWSAIVDGIKIELLQFESGKNALVIDGEEMVTNKGNGVMMTTLPSGRVIQGAVFKKVFDFTAGSGHLLVDGELVAGEAWPVGRPRPAVVPELASRPPAESPNAKATHEPEAEPEDPRWKAAKTLIDSARELGGSQGGVLEDLAVQIRRRILVIEHLQETAQAYRVLNPDGGDDLVTPHEQILKALLDDLQSLHSTLATGATRPEEVDDEVGNLIENLRADLEVRRVDEELARKARLARARRMQRQ